jgi:HK97 family phage major capsid protein
MLEKNLSTEARAATPASTTDAVGGYTIPEGFSYILEKFMAWYGPFADAGANAPYYLLNSTSGNDIPWPTVDDTANSGYQIAESGDITTSSTGFTFGVETLKAYAWTSGLVPVTRQIIQDSGLPFVDVVLGLLAERLGRAKNTACTTGTGSTAPEGVITGATQGKHTASATAFTQSELMDLVYSVDPAYRMSPKAGFMMNPNIVSAIRKLDISTSNYTQPLFQPSLAAGVPDRILGYQYWENSAMASTLTTTSKIILFGDFNKFVIRNVKAIEILRSEERYLEFLQIAFLAWMRFDSRVINENALKYLELT